MNGDGMASPSSVYVGDKYACSASQLGKRPLQANTWTMGKVVANYSFSIFCRTAGAVAAVGASSR